MWNSFPSICSSKYFNLHCLHPCLFSQCFSFLPFWRRCCVSWHVTTPICMTAEYWRKDHHPHVRVHARYEQNGDSSPVQTRVQLWSKRPLVPFRIYVLNEVFTIFCSPGESLDSGSYSWFSWRLDWTGGSAVFSLDRSSFKM